MMNGYTLLELPVNTFVIDMAVQCPYCDTRMVPRISAGVTDWGQDSRSLMTISVCTMIECSQPFLESFRLSTIKDPVNKDLQFFFDGKVQFYPPFLHESDEIDAYKKLVKNRPYYRTFVKIYEQAFSAESDGLDLIAGMGYRKSLEFLLKDYAIYLFPDQENVIQKRLLGNLITTFFRENLALTITATRAAWLGNDESHYLRKWQNHGIEDLKKLIQTTLHWIEASELTKDYEREIQ